MADQASVFTKEETPPENTGAPPAEPQEQENVNPPKDPYVDLLGSIKNQDGGQKYDSIEKALDALKHSQEFIPTLESELHDKDAEIKRLREVEEKLGGLDAVLERLANNDRSGDDDNHDSSGLDRQAVSELVRNELVRTEAEKRSVANLNTVQSALVDKFGEKATSEIRAKAKEMGTTPQALEALAKTSPAIVLKLFETQGTNNSSVTTGDITSPLNRHEADELKLPERSLLSGASTKDITNFMSKVKADVYRKYGIEN